MATLIVSSCKAGPKAYGVQKYDNNEPWNVVGGMAPMASAQPAGSAKLNPTCRYSPRSPHSWLPPVTASMSPAECPIPAANAG